MIKRGFVMLAMSIALLFVSRQAFAVGYCCIDDPSCTYHLGTPIDDTQPTFMGNPCTHLVTGSSCTFNVNRNLSGAHNADCLLIGAGVTVNLHDNTIDCPNTSGIPPCGTAIVVTNAGGGSSKTQLSAGNVTGCWTSGVKQTGGSSGASMDGFIIDLSGGSNCPSGTTRYGVGAPQGLLPGYGLTPVSHTTVRNAPTVGIVVGTGTLSDSLVVGSGTANGSTGIWLSAGSIDNVTVHSANHNLVNQSTSPVSVTDSVSYDAGCNLNFYSSGSFYCHDSDLYGFSFSGTSDIADDLIY